MEDFSTDAICSLTQGSLAEGGSTVDSHLVGLFRPHIQPPTALRPAGIYVLPLAERSTFPRSCRRIHDIQFAPHDPSLLFTSTSDDAMLAFDMNTGGFFSEIQLSAGVERRNGAPHPIKSPSCVHVSRYQGAPLIFSGSQDGDIFVFDARIQSLNVRFSRRNPCPTLRLPAAHDGSVCGIRSGLALQPHVFVTGGREDRWIRLFDLRFPFHYTSSGSSCQTLVPYPLEAARLGPRERDDGIRECLLAFDLSPDGSLLAASVAHCHAVALGLDELGEVEGGETILLSLRDGARALKTIASADASSSDFIQFSANGKYVLQTGGVRAVHCKACRHCVCCCFCAAEPPELCMSNAISVNQGIPFTKLSGNELQGEALPARNGFVTRHPLPSVGRCSYHRAQLVNLIQSNRCINLKSPADSAIAFSDSFCFSHSHKSQPSRPTAADVVASSSVGDGTVGSHRQLLTSHEAGANDLSQLRFTLYGPRSVYVQKCRHRFWKYLSELQAQLVTGPPENAQVPPEGVGCTSQFSSGLSRKAQIGGCGGDQKQSKKLHLSAEVKGDGSEYTCANEEKLPTQAIRAAVVEPDGLNRCLLFPLLHPQLSQFIAACGPLHPAFVRAEAASFPFTCRLWGGLVVGFGGSIKDRHGNRRLYDGIKLWDSATGVVLSWTEGYLVRLNTCSKRSFREFIVQCNTQSPWEVFSPSV